MVKYERERAGFYTIKDLFKKHHSICFMWSQILYGWETEELKRLIEESDKNAKAVLCEVENLITMIEKRMNL